MPAPILSALAVQQFLLPLPQRVDSAQTHLTLVFLGEVPDPVLEDLHDGLQALHLPGFDLSLQGLGLFGGARPRTVFAAVAPCPPLDALQAKVAQVARRAGVDLPSRRFVPHVTLGRFPPPEAEIAMRLERGVAAGAGFRAGPWHVDRMILWESHLSAKGARYDELAHYPLAGALPGQGAAD